MKLQKVRPSKQTRRQKVPTGLTRPEATAEAATSRQWTTAVTVKPNKGQEITACSSEDTNEHITEMILLETDHQRHRRIGQATDNTRNEEGSSANEATERLHRSAHRHTDTRTTKEHHTKQMGLTQQKNRGARTHRGKRVYRTRHRH